MTIMDKQLEFDPALTAITSTTTSTNVIDLGVGRDLLVNRRFHTVYRVGVPLSYVAQLGVLYLAAVGPDWWVRIGRAIAG